MALGFRKDLHSEPPRGPGRTAAPEERAWRAAAAAVDRAAKAWATATMEQRAATYAEYVRALATEERAAASYERSARVGAGLVGL